MNELDQLYQQVILDHSRERHGSGALIDPDHPMTMRQDEAENTFRRDELLKNAPQVQAGCVVVPRIVE